MFLPRKETVMAKKVMSFFSGTKGPEHGNCMYPWDTWADGNIWEAVKGADFDCELSSFRGLLHSHASRSGIKVQLQTLTRLGKVRFRFYNPALESSETDAVVGQPDTSESTETPVEANSSDGFTTITPAPWGAVEIQ